ncbi:MAG: type II toxin-antitoxin system PemK/MazF family toxin [Gemmatimonadales bacterium]|nr:type II toxin-antitoxin system PemK/MazF family toxin [Gemmatimonadales bacterium]
MLAELRGVLSSCHGRSLHPKWWGLHGTGSPPDLFNKHTGLCIACPITNTHRDYPFHVAVQSDEGITGFVMVEQVKSTNFRSRKAKRLGAAPEAMFDEVLSILDACIY